MKQKQFQVIVAYSLSFFIYTYSTMYMYKTQGITSLG